jgi:hypothetical protein
MSQPELLKRVVEALDRANVPYMFVGSTVSSLQGQPRSTHDIDIVVQISPEGGEQLVAAFPLPDYLLDPFAVRAAIANRKMFNLLDNVGGDKADFWVLDPDTYKQQAFSRRIRGRLAGVDVWVQAPEDTILSKLHWAKDLGGSEKQFKDALSVYEVQFGRLDLTYLEHWAKELKVSEDLQRIKEIAEVIEP